MKRSPFASHGSVLATCCLLLASCGGDDGLGPDRGSSTLVLELTNFAALNATLDGAYQAWVVDQSDQVRSAGRFALAGGASQSVTLSSPVSNPKEVYVTVEPPGDADDQVTGPPIIGAKVTGATTELSYVSYLTPGVPFIETPGSHVLFTPSDNDALGYPSNEDSGIWLFEFHGDSADATFWLDMAPPDRGWLYEGWMVLDYGQPGAVWFSYGKFEADSDQKAAFRDDTGPGPYSGQLNYKDALPEEVVMPGDDWVSNPLGIPLPGGLPESILPLDLNGCKDLLDQQGQVLLACRDFWRGPSRFTHVITMEPEFNQGEDVWTARPFFVEVYKNEVGEGSPEVRRVLVYQGESLPRGVARIQAGG
jgi:hypothetical protein